MSRYTWSLPILIILLVIMTSLAGAPFMQSGSADPGLPHASVMSVRCDKQDNCWFATWGGIGVYSARDNAWVSFTPEDSGLAHEYCHDVAAEEGGRVWIAHHSGTGASLLETNGTLFDKNDDRWTYFTESDGLPHGYGWLETVTVDSNGRVWFGHSLGASRLDIMGTPNDKSDDQWAHFSNDDLQLGPGFVNAILEDSQGCFWFGGDDGISRMCGGSVFVPQVASVPGCEACCWTVQWLGWVWDLAEDQDGDIWAADGNCGAAEWNGSNWTVCDVNDPACGLPTDNEPGDPGIKAVAVDRNNNIWFGTRGRGVARRNGFDDWQLYTSGDDSWLGSNQIEDIDFNGLNQGWFAALGGAFFYDEEDSSTSQVTPANGGEVTATSGRAKAFFPPESVSITTTVQIVHNPVYPSAGVHVLNAFDLSAAPAVSFNNPYTLTVLYEESSAAPFDDEDFALYWLAGDQWMPEPTGTIDLDNNRLVATPDHMTVFALLVEVNQVFIPSLVR